MGQFRGGFHCHFEALTSYTLTINVVGQGTVTRNPDLPNYRMNDTVYVTATPASGWSFDGWTGDEQSQNSSIVIIMTRNTSVTANFTQAQQQTTISGIVTWPGHTLSGHTYAFADSLSGSSLYLVGQTNVNPTNGAFTITLANTSTLHLLFEAQDDDDTAASGGG